MRGAHNHLGRKAAVLGAAGVVTGGGNLLFNLIVARQGGPQAYGAIGALLALLLVPGVVATSTTYTVALAVIRDGLSGVPALRRAARATVPWLVVAAVAIVFAEPLATYLRLPGPFAAVIAVLFGTGMIVLSAPLGVLLGTGQIMALGLLTIATPVLRVSLELLMQRVIAVVDAALLSSAVAVAITVAAGWALALRAHHADRPEASRRAAAFPVGRQSIEGALVAGGVFAVWALPLSMARHSFAPSQAGSLAAVQLLASAIAVYLAGPLLTAYYPAIAEHRDVRIVRGGLLATCIVSCLGAALLVVVGPFALHVLYGAGFSAPLEWFALCGISACAVAFASFWVWTARALGRLRLFTAGWVLATLIAELCTALIPRLSPAVLAAAPAGALLCGLAITAVFARVASLAQAASLVRRRRRGTAAERLQMGAAES